MRCSFTNVGAMLVFAALAGCDVFTSVDDRIQRAEQLEKEGSYGEAMVELRNALAEKPKDPRAQLVLARTTYQLGNLDAAGKAIAAAQAAGATPETVDPLQVKVLLARSEYAAVLEGIDSGRLKLDERDRELARTQALGGLGRCDEALKLADTLTAAHPESTGQRIVAAECRGRNGDSARAREELEAGLRANPKSAELQLAHGRILQLVGRRADAEAAWLEAAKLARGQLSVGQQVLLYAGLIDLQIDRNDLAAARTTQQQLDRLAPQRVTTQLRRARIAIAAGELAESIVILRQIVVNLPDFPPARLLLASALLAENNVEQARREFDWLAQRSTDPGLQRARDITGKLPEKLAPSEDYWLLVAAVQVSLGEYGAARLALTQAQKLAPDSPRARVAAGDIALRTGNLTAAREAAEAVLAAHPEDPEAMELLAHARVLEGRSNDALMELESLWRRQPSAALALSLHRVRKQMKSPAADEPLQRWLAQHPDDIAIRGIYADSLRVAGNHAAAILEYERLSAAAPDNVLLLNNLAWLYYLTGDKRGISIARRAHAIEPRSPSVADTLGWLLVESGAVREGLPLLRQADQAARGHSAEIRYHYAAGLARSGDRVQAGTMLNELLARPGSFATRMDAERLRGELARQPE
jgi:predicted Zn-dependent protease